MPTKPAAHADRMQRHPSSDPQHQGDLEDYSCDAEDQEDEAMTGSGAARGGADGRRSWKRWTAHEHALLAQLVSKHGINRSWSLIASHIPGRTGKQCRERWLNHTTPDSKRGGWSADEEFVLAQQHSICGSQWCRISRSLPGRTDNSVKNHWNATLRSKVMMKPQSILWLYTAELKRGQEPSLALKHALLQWEHNVPSHLVIETLGFWPSQEYAAGGPLQAEGDNNMDNNNVNAATVAIKTNSSNDAGAGGAPAPGSMDVGGEAGGIGALAQVACLEQEQLQQRGAAAVAAGLQPTSSSGSGAHQQQQQQRAQQHQPMEGVQQQHLQGGPNNNNCSDDSCVSKATMQPPTPAVTMPHHVQQHSYAAAAPQQQHLQENSSSRPATTATAMAQAPAAEYQQQQQPRPHRPPPPPPVLVASDAAGLSALPPAHHGHVQVTNGRAVPLSPNTNSEQLSCGARQAAAAGAPVVPRFTNSAHQHHQHQVNAAPPPPSAPLLEAAAAAAEAEAALTRRASHDSSTTQGRQQQQQRRLTGVSGSGPGLSAPQPQHFTVLPPATPSMLPSATLPAGLTPTSSAMGALGPLSLSAPAQQQHQQQQQVQLVSSSHGQLTLLASGGPGSALPATRSNPQLPASTVPELTVGPTLHLGGSSSNHLSNHNNRSSVTGGNGVLSYVSGAALPPTPPLQQQQIVWQQQQEGGGVGVGGRSNLVAAHSCASSSSLQQVVWLPGPNGTLTPHSVTFLEQPTTATIAPQHQLVFVPPSAMMMPPQHSAFSNPSASAGAGAPFMPTVVVPAPSAAVQVQQQRVLGVAPQASAPPASTTLPARGSASGHGPAPPARQDSAPQPSGVRRLSNGALVPATTNTNTSVAVVNANNSMSAANLLPGGGSSVATTHAVSLRRTSTTSAADVAAVAQHRAEQQQQELMLAQHQQRQHQQQQQAAQQEREWEQQQAMEAQHQQNQQNLQLQHFQQQQQVVAVGPDGATAAAQVLTLMMQDGQLMLGPAHASAGGGGPAVGYVAVGGEAGASSGMDVAAGAGGSRGTLPSPLQLEHQMSFGGGGNGGAGNGQQQGMKLVLSQHQQQALLQMLLAQQGISVVV